MGDFFQRHRNLVISSVYVALTLLLAGYVVLYQTRAANISDLGRAARALKAENKELDKVRQATRKRTETREEGIKSIPLFLSHINSIARRNNVILRQLTPDDQVEFKHTIEIIVDYETFLRFTADLESHDTVINEMQVRPYDAKAVPPTHFITFSITPRNDARPLTDERITKIRSDVGKKNKRNPFQRLEPIRGLPPLIDLTWVYHLTGIGREGERRYATIDRKDHYVDDTIGGTKIVITSIDKDRVFLEEETSSGKQRYGLGFRRKSTN